MGIKNEEYLGTPVWLGEGRDRVYIHRDLTQDDMITVICESYALGVKAGKEEAINKVQELLVGVDNLL